MLKFSDKKYLTDDDVIQYTTVKMLLDDGVYPVISMGRGNSKYDGKYRLLHIISCDGGKFKCVNGYSWNHAYPVDIFGNRLTLNVYALMREGNGGD